MLDRSLPALPLSVPLKPEMAPVAMFLIASEISSEPKVVRLLNPVVCRSKKEGSSSYESRLMGG